MLVFKVVLYCSSSNLVIIKLPNIRLGKFNKRPHLLLLQLKLQIEFYNKELFTKVHLGHNEIAPEMTKLRYRQLIKLLIKELP